MHINTVWFNDQFNVELCSQQGREPFLSIKGCRIVSGQKGEFVSWPARKLDNGKWWNHCYASEAFSAAVLERAKETEPKRDTRTVAERRSSKADDDIPF